MGQLTTYQILSSILGIIGFVIAIGNLIWNFRRDRERFNLDLETIGGLYGPELLGVVRNIGNCPIYLERILVFGPNNLKEQIGDSMDQHIGPKQNFKFDLKKYQVKPGVEKFLLKAITKTGKSEERRLIKT